MILLILLILFSCKTVEKNLDPIFKANISQDIDNKPKHKCINTKFVEDVNLFKKQKYSLEPLKGGERTYYFKGEIDILKNIFKNYDLELDINKYVYDIPVKVGDFEFPENIVFMDKKDTVVLTYDFKSKQLLEIFRLERYNFDLFKSYCRFFKDLNGYTIFMLNEDKNYADLTPFKNRTSFCTAKIGFRKTDFIANKNYITSYYINKEVSGLYSSIVIDTTIQKYEIPLINYLINIINQKIDDHIKKNYAIYDFFFDEYEETPYFEVLKDYMFNLAIESIDLLEDLTAYHLGKYKVVNPYDPEEVKEVNKNINEKQQKELVIKYDKECKALFNLLNESINKIEKDNSDHIRKYISNTIKENKDFIFFKKNKRSLINYFNSIRYIKDLKARKNV